MMEGIDSVASAESWKLGTQLENLPDVLLLHILSFFPTADVVRTSALAKRWQNFWKLVSHVDIEEGEEDTEGGFLEHFYKRVSFLNFVENVMLKRDSSNMDYFTLSLRVLGHASKINSWISAALTHKVQKLCLKLRQMHDEDFELPSCLFTCQFLTQLKIDMTTDLRLPPTTWLPGLEELTLQQVTFPEDISTIGLFSGCPNLKKLSLTYCDWSKVRAICISAPRLEQLIIIDNEMYHCNSHKAPQVVIFAANLKLFSFTGDLNNDYFVHSPALVEGFINFYPSEDPIGDRELAHRLNRLLWQLSGVKSLSISNDALEVLDCAKDLLAHLPSFGRLDSLYLIQSHTVFPSEALWTILQKSPRLGLLDFDYGFWSGDFEGMPVINPVPSCFSTHLKTIRIWLREEEEELYYLSELLRVGSVLEKVYIRSFDSKNIPDAILRMYRQSRNCVIYHSISCRSTEFEVKQFCLSCNSASHSSWPN